MAAIATFGSATLPSVAAADPPPWAGVWKHDKKRNHKRDDDLRVVYVPVPMVTEGRGHRGPPVARGLPYGFARGTCDRDLVSSELIGNVIGGAAGGVAGSRFGQGQGKTAAIIGGTLLGALVGGSVGRGMDAADQGCVLGALEHLPDERAIAWDGRGGETFRMMPVRSWQGSSGSYCREYQATALIDGRPQQTYGTACRQPDGAWAIVD